MSVEIRKRAPAALITTFLYGAFSRFCRIVAVVSRGGSCLRPNIAIFLFRTACTF